MRVGQTTSGMVRAASVIAAILAVMALSHGPTTAQSDTRSTLVGSWENGMEPVDDNVPIITEITYADDGTYSGIRRTKMGEVFRTEVIEGTWQIDEAGVFDFMVVRQPYDGGEAEVELLNWENADLITGDDETPFYRRVYPEPNDPSEPPTPEA